MGLKIESCSFKENFKMRDLIKSFIENKKYNPDFRTLIESYHIRACKPKNPSVRGSFGKFVEWHHMMICY